MSPVSGKRLCKVLENLGWVLERITGSHHVYSRPDHPLPVSVPVHGHRDLKAKTRKNIMRSAGPTFGPEAVSLVMY